MFLCTIGHLKQNDVIGQISGVEPLPAQRALEFERVEHWQEGM